MGRHDSPDSPLSDISSGQDSFDDDHHIDDEPPTKRQKILGRALTPVITPVDPEPEPDTLDDASAISSDTEGDIPSSPIGTRYDEEDFQEQVSRCAWERCTAGDLQTMDKLVEHIHNDHIEGKQRKYTCEWVGCQRKSMPHASGYALKAHMRSHTREKPFYCYLPECDRAFTRSDALAKHMRTVHETEALRPSDPVPKSMQVGAPTKASSKPKIIIKMQQSNASGHDEFTDDGSDDVAEFFTPLTKDQGFSEKEVDMDLDRLHRLCRMQLRWATQEQEELEKEIDYWNEQYKKEWLETEVLVSQVFKSEIDWHQRRTAILSGATDIHLAPEVVVNGPAASAKESGGEVRASTEIA